MARNLIVGSLPLRDWSDVFNVLNSHGDRGFLNWWHGVVKRCNCNRP